MASGLNAKGIKDVAGMMTTTGGGASPLSPTSSD
jgi:hypothetical protein